jgi:uncharacterized protein YacL
MARQNFKQLFSIVVALILGALGLTLGFALETYIKQADAGSMLNLFQAAAINHPYYLNALVTSLGVIGLLMGVVLAPKVADRLVDTGNAVERMSAKDKVAVGFGAFVGLALSSPFFVLSFLVTANLWRVICVLFSLLLAIAFVYLGIRGITSMKDELRFIGPSAVPEPEEVNPTANCKILDTNVIIDGRIADVCRTGFLEGPLYVPGFVLEELQHIADSGDGLKRARGRRGLDILNTMQKELPLVVRSWDKALDKAFQGEEVDTKLVRLAKALEGMIVTNDFNLNKVAMLQGVQVLNVNELANALKPVVLPGEVMIVGIVKEGKEPNQGVAYLDDGTMIVVEDGRKFIGGTQPVIVSSVLQTSAGKMIFARVRTDEDGDGYDYNAGREQRGDNQNGSGNYQTNSGSGFTRRGPGKKVR